MGFSFSGAAAGATDALEQMMVRKRAEYLQQQMLERQAQQDARQAQQDAANAAYRDEQIGMQRKQFDAGRQDKADAAAKTAKGDADFGAFVQTLPEAVRPRIELKRRFGVDMPDAPAPPKRTVITTLGPRGEPIKKALTDDELAGGVPDYVTPPAKDNSEQQHRFRMEEIAAQGDQARKTASTRAAPEGQSPYSAERAKRAVDSVDELIKKVGPMTAGLGSMLSHIPATSARNFAAELEVLKSNITQSELTAMREASKTGGALGQVSDRENTMLASALGALDPGQSPQNLVAQLQKIKASIQRWQQAVGQSGGPMTATVDGGNLGAVPTITGIREIK